MCVQGRPSEARRKLRALPVRCLASHRTRGPGAPGRLVNAARGARAADALLAVRQEGGEGRCGRQAEAARSTEESALGRCERSATGVTWRIRLLGRYCGRPPARGLRGPAEMRLKRIRLLRLNPASKFGSAVSLE